MLPCTAFGSLFEVSGAVETSRVTCMVFVFARSEAAAHVMLGQILAYQHCRSVVSIGADPGGKSSYRRALWPVLFEYRESGFE